MRPESPMTAFPFNTPIALCGELRAPRQMLADQTYDDHKSIHDDAMAADLGLRAGPIEGPTHFSLFDPLLVALWGPAWFETGCISAHYQTMVVEGEETRAFVQQPAAGARFTRIWAEKRDGTPVLTGTASVGAPAADDPPTEIAGRIARLRPSGPLVINRDLRVGQQGAGNPERVRMGFDQHMGGHYPFTLADKLKVITEPCAWYTPEGGPSSPWGRAIIPTEMVSVLLGSTIDQANFRGRGPAVGLFAGQQIRYLQGPLFVDHPYELEREIIALSESARTESVWMRTRVFDGVTRAPVAEMVLNGATLKASYEPYEREARALGRSV
ncbi:hypothetical protein [Ramlibacter tataouinensis]|nr:hypothetical protein [Ramlibacter tataouinensis]